jgi:hypothetical protein
MSHSNHRAHRSRQRYHVDEKGIRIEIKVKTASQLFDARDPAPFLERDLDDDAVEYLVSSAEEFAVRTPMKVVIHVAEPLDPSLDPAAIREAIHNYFDYRAELLRMRLTRVMKTGQLFLMVGVFFLTLCLVLAQTISRMVDGTTGTVLREGLVITGWVAMWRPIDLFLFDWWPLLEKRRYHEKLAHIDIEIRVAKSSSNPELGVSV